MSPQRYEPVSTTEDDGTPISSHDQGQGQQQAPIPASPPPSFHSRASSPIDGRRSLSHRDPFLSEAERALADSFDPNTDDEDSDREDGRQRDTRMRGSTEPRAASSSSDADAERRPLARRVTELPVFTTPTASTQDGTQRRITRSPNDGVFANMSAKPDRGEKLEDQPPSYEQAAADATPPYWETTIMAPGFGTDEVFIDGLPVGSLFSFAWNGLISMSFQIVGFLLTYLLHTTHAAKNGSKAGLGIMLVQMGFQMKSSRTDNLVVGGGGGVDGDGQPQYTAPQDPNSHDVKALTDDLAALAALTHAPNGGGGGGGGAGVPAADPSWSLTNNDWLAYGLMIIGWFILIKAVSNYVRVRRHEQLVLQSPDRGLSVPIVAEGERPETVV